MTAKYLKTTGMNLYKLNGDSYCKMMDVVKLIEHEMLENEFHGADDKAVKDLLDRMEMRVVKNSFVLDDAKKPTDIGGEEPEPENIPGRYAVGREKPDGWEFIAGNVGEVPLMTRKPCAAQLFVAYRDASAYVDFLEEDGWQVLDWEDNMTEEDRWLRELRTPFPYDLDDGFEDALPVVVKGK